MRKRKRQSEITGRWFYPVQHFDFVVNHSIDDVVERLRQRHQESRGCLDLRYLVQVEINDDKSQDNTSFNMYSSNFIANPKQAKNTLTIQGEVKPRDNMTCIVSGQARIDKDVALQMYGLLLLCMLAYLLQEITGVKSLTIFILPFPIYFMFWLQVSDRKALLKELERTLYTPRKSKAKAKPSAFNISTERPSS